MCVLEQTLDALKHLKKYQITHKNLKPTNILVIDERKIKIKVSDFILTKGF